MSMDMSGVEFNRRGRGAASERGESGFLAGFERKVLFRIARFVAFAICFLLFLGIVGGVAFLVSSMSGADKPDPAQVVQELRPSAPRAGSQPRRAQSAILEQQSPLVGLRVSPEVQDLTSHGDNRQVVERWVSEFDRADRQPFLDGLGEAIREATKHGVAASDAANAYQSHYEVYVVERAVQQLASVQSRLYVAGSVVSVLLLLALFSLVLVLLAIERNTYRTANLLEQS